MSEPITLSPFWTWVLVSAWAVAASVVTALACESSRKRRERHDEEASARALSLRHAVEAPYSALRLVSRTPDRSGKTPPAA